MVQSDGASNSCQQAVTSATRSSRGGPHGRPRRTASASSRRDADASFPKERGLTPANGAIQVGSACRDHTSHIKIITPCSARRSFGMGRGVLLHCRSVLRRQPCILRKIEPAVLLREAPGSVGEGVERRMVESGAPDQGEG